MDITYVYILTEDGSQVGDLLKHAATGFAAIHKDDAAVGIIVRQSQAAEFESARQAFEVRCIPALVFSDEAHGFSGRGRVGRYIALDRGALERYVVRDGTSMNAAATTDVFYNLLADFNYVVRDESLLYLKRNLTTQRIVNFLRATWEEVKDLVSINVSPG